MRRISGRSRTSRPALGCAPPSILFDVTNIGIPEVGDLTRRPHLACPRAWLTPVFLVAAAQEHDGRCRRWLGVLSSSVAVPPSSQPCSASHIGKTGRHQISAGRKTDLFCFQESDWFCLSSKRSLSYGNREAEKETLEYEPKGSSEHYTGDHWPGLRVVGVPKLNITPPEGTS